MTILDARGRPLEARALSHEDPELQFLVRPNASSGVSVTPRTAFASATAAACTRAISEGVALLPAHAFRLDASGDRERDRTSPEARLLSRPNPWTDMPALLALLVSDALLHRDGGLAVAIRVDGQVRELQRVDPGGFTAERDPETWEPRYRYTIGSGTQRVISWRDALHVVPPGWSFDRPWCPLQLAAEAIGLDLALGRHMGGLMRQGGRPSGVLSSDKSLSSNAITRMGKSWSESFSGDRAGSVAVLEEGLRFQPLAFNLADTQFAEQRVQVWGEIARAFRIPPPIIGLLERATWSNSEQMGRWFLDYCLQPWLDNIASGLERVLFTPEERDSRFVEFETAAYLASDTAALFASLRTATGSAVLTPNEARQRLNLPAHADGDRLILQAGQSAGGADNTPTTPSTGGADGGTTA